MLISIEDLADGRAEAPLLGEGGAIADPLLLVDLAVPASPAALGRASARAGSGRLLVGLGPRSPELSPALDVTLCPADAAVRAGVAERSGGEGARESAAGSLGPADAGAGVVPVPSGAGGRDCVFVADPEGAAGRLAVFAEKYPQAAVALAGVLRTTVELPVPLALDVESYAYSTLLGGAEFASWLGGRRAFTPPADVAEPVRAVRDGDTLRLTLNRPERRNAYGRQLRDALVELLGVAVLDGSVRRVVLDGAGPAFCAGGDLAEFGTTPDLATAHYVRTRGGAGLLLHRLAGRTEVRLHGACVGAGIELPAFAGTVVADPGTTFRLPEVAMGLIPGAGGTVGIPRRIGRWRAFYLALSGVALPAGTARAWGLVDRVAERDRAGLSGGSRW